MVEQSIWMQKVVADPGHSQWYIERFRSMAQAGQDLAGEARLVDAMAVAVDVGHATDHPDCDNRKFGETKLGGGPILCRGANINPLVYKKLLAAARAAKIPHQFEADPRPTGTDARAIQMGRGGVATRATSRRFRMDDRSKRRLKRYWTSAR